MRYSCNTCTFETDIRVEIKNHAAILGHFGWTDWEVSKMKKVADCGVDFEHDAHVYKTPRGKVKACDGSTRKR